MLTQEFSELSPRIAKDLDELDSLHEPRPPGFLHWIVEETDRLRARILSGITWEERLRTQNEIASLSGMARCYGQWLYHGTHWNAPSTVPRRPSTRMIRIERRAASGEPAPDRGGRDVDGGADVTGSSRERAGRPKPLVEPLTRRLTDREIAEALSISTFTVKRHAASIYSKLGVEGRRKAVTRALDLGLIVAAERRLLLDARRGTWSTNGG